MKKLEKTFRKSIVLTIGKIFTLCGIAVTFAACYGVMEPSMPTPDYWENAKEEALTPAAEEQVNPELSSGQEDTNKSEMLQ